ncbi:MAG: hypothetical protein QM657_04460 [Lacrimispora sp.]|uniref:DUF6273 domain-containing protein n=1 Tax=Lacrimispora sp. TaxID=2719234 RepID=UPI0039E61530
MKGTLYKVKGVWRIFMCAALMFHLLVIEGSGEVMQEGGRWSKDEGGWYFFDERGLAVSGWVWSGGYWYFLNPDVGGSYGRMMAGWQWIDGRCYYLAEGAGVDYPEGAMYRNGVTPDGFLVNDSGAWFQDDGVVEVYGKGIRTVSLQGEMSASKKASGGGGKRTGAGGGGKRPGGDSGGGNSETGGQIPEGEPEETLGEGEESEVQKEECEYTVRYVDIVDRVVLQLAAGVGVKGESVVVKWPDIEGYQLCGGQKGEFWLSSNNMVISVYYEKMIPASPSEACKVDWNLYFVEEGNPRHEILKPQKGKTEEGKELLINFPETILGADRYYYHALVSSPWSVIVNGSGVQKYYIKFKRGERLPEEADPDQEARNKLNSWLDIIRESDFKITGDWSSYHQIITENIQESNERLLNMASMADGTGRQEIYLIAKGHVPNSLILSQTFPDIRNISELVREEFTILGAPYVVLRIGFEKTYEESTCSHDYEVTDEVSAGCAESGHKTVKCLKCGKEETIILPVTGHKDGDHDGVCDICYEPVKEVQETVHYSIGDVVARTIGGGIYLFRCIDDDYEDVMGNSQKTALFLCDSVIRSDVEGPEKKMNFGPNNNYKHSKVRQWLTDQADADFVHETYIGVTRSFQGVTGKGMYEQLNENDLIGFDRGFQLLQDRVFILSVDEALEYRDYLWKFNGSETNNPESQLSAYSKGYYLRTPQDNGLDDLWYGDGIYSVSLVNGNIQPVNVGDMSMGIRPVMAIPQGG